MGGKHQAPSTKLNQIPKPKLQIPIKFQISSSKESGGGGPMQVACAKFERNRFSFVHRRIECRRGIVLLGESQVELVQIVNHAFDSKSLPHHVASLPSQPRTESSVAGQAEHTVLQSSQIAGGQ